MIPTLDKYGKVIAVIRDSAAPRNPYVSGYGNKIPTRYRARLEGDERFRRIYAICYANAATFYVLVKGERVYVHDWDLL